VLLGTNFRVLLLCAAVVLLRLRFAFGLDGVRRLGPV
jgi:hypothetical protein